MPREFDLADCSSLSLNVSGNVVIYFENRSKTREPFGECENLFNLNLFFFADPIRHWQKTILWNRQ